MMNLIIGYLRVRVIIADANAVNNCMVCIILN